MRATNDATDLTLCVRLRVLSDLSKLSLASKFGAMHGETKALLFAASQAEDALGICLHLGSQGMAPEPNVNAMERVSEALVEAAGTGDVVEVGGGFPRVYTGRGPAERGRSCTT